MAVVCNLPQLKFVDMTADDLPPSMPLPCILFMDSMKCHRTQKVAGLIRRYVASDFRVDCCVNSVIPLAIFNPLGMKK